MARIRTLNSKERKHFFEQLTEQYGLSKKFDYAILYNEAKQKYYFQNEAASNVDTIGFRVETIGLYVASTLTSGEIRLTIEGSQLLGPHCEKQILFLDDETWDEWLRGEELPITGTEQGWLLIAHKNKETDETDFAGSGKVVIKESEDGKVTKLLHNYIPKARYVRG